MRGGGKRRLLRSRARNDIIPAASPCDGAIASLFRRGIPQRYVLYVRMYVRSLVQIVDVSLRLSVWLSVSLARWIGSLAIDRALAGRSIFNQQPCQLPALFDLPLPPSPSLSLPSFSSSSSSSGWPLRRARSRLFPSLARACERPRKLYLYPPTAAVARLSLSRAQRRRGCCGSVDEKNCQRRDGDEREKGTSDRRRRCDDICTSIPLSNADSSVFLCLYLLNR